MRNEYLINALREGNSFDLLVHLNLETCSPETFNELKTFINKRPERGYLIECYKQARLQRAEQALKNFDDLFCQISTSHDWSSSPIFLLNDLVYFDHAWEALLLLLLTPIFHDFLQLFESTGIVREVSEFFAKTNPQFLQNKSTKEQEKDHALLLAILKELFTYDSIIKYLDDYGPDLLHAFFDEKNPKYLPLKLQELLWAKASLYGLPLSSFGSRKDINEFFFDPGEFLRKQGASPQIAFAVNVLKSCSLTQSLKREGIKADALFPLFLEQFKSALKECPTLKECKSLYEGLVFVGNNRLEAHFGFAQNILKEKNFSFTHEQAQQYNIFFEKLSKGDFVNQVIAWAKERKRIEVIPPSEIKPFIFLLLINFSRFDASLKIVYDAYCSQAEVSSSFPITCGFERERKAAIAGMRNDSAIGEDSKQLFPRSNESSALPKPK